MDMPFEDRWFPINEAATDVLKISRAKTYELIREKKLRIVKLGTRSFVTGRELKRFMTQIAKAA